MKIKFCEIFFLKLVNSNWGVRFQSSARFKRRGCAQSSTNQVEHLMFYLVEHLMLLWVIPQRISVSWQEFTQLCWRKSRCIRSENSNYKIDWLPLHGENLWKTKRWLFFFFLPGFSFTDTDDSQDSRGSERTIFYSTVPLSRALEYSDICLQLCMWDDYHIFLIAPLVFTWLLFDGIYHLELPFDWLMMWC